MQIRTGTGHAARYPPASTNTQNKPPPQRASRDRYLGACGILTPQAVLILGTLSLTLTNNLIKISNLLFHTVSTFLGVANAQKHDTYHLVMLRALELHGSVRGHPKFWYQKKKKIFVIKETSHTYKLCLSNSDTVNRNCLSPTSTMGKSLSCQMSPCGTGRRGRRG